MSVLPVNSTNANGNNFLHRHVALTHTQQLANIFPASTSTAVSVTAKTTPTALFITKVATVNSTGSGYGILTQAYSYDGVLHVDSFRSDI